jgi:glucose/arabinose dehydrogenase
MLTRFRIVAAVILAGGLLVGGCERDAVGTPRGAAGAAGAAPAATVGPEVAVPAGAVRTVATGLNVPWGVAFLPDGTALVTERGYAANLGPYEDRRTQPTPPRVVSVRPDGAVTEVRRFDSWQAAPGGVRASGEVGLLGVAVGPQYATDGWIYVYYTTYTSANESDNRIVRFRGDGPLEPILTGIPASNYHAGGRIAFGPDGMLYASTGETWFTRDIAQDPASLGGKILRMTPDGRPAPGNPFPNSVVYSLGHRNVQGLAWDSRGRLFASELGYQSYDELNLIEAGRNYGWPVAEGPSTDRRFTNPVATWSPTAIASPSGIAIVGDSVYVACLAGRRLYRVSLDGRTNEPMLVGRYGRLRTVAVAPDGSLWLTTSNRDQVGASSAGPEDDRILRLAL